MSDDSHRFAADAAKQLGSNYGVYGGGITPGVALKSATGINRGEELFHRPELVRTWRTPTAQRHAEAIVEKEQEIEVLTRRCTELRAQLAGASRELQKSYATHKMDSEKMKVAADAEVAALKAELAALKKVKDDTSKDAEHKVALMRAQHEAELAVLNKKLKLSSDIANEMSSSFMNQMNEVKQSAAREIDLVQRLCHARTSELTNEIQVANDAAKKVTERALASSSDLQSEMRRNEDRISSQLKQQEQRFEAMRQTMQLEKTEAERQRDKAVADYAAMNEKMKNLSYDLSETETRYREWNARLLPDLERIAEFYSGLMRDIEGSNVVAPPSDAFAKISDSYIPPRMVGEADYRRLLVKVAEAVHQLTWIKQHHSNASQHLLRRLKAAEGFDKVSVDAVQKNQLEHEFQFNRLLNEMLESKAHQSRLESALKEIKDSFIDVESRITSTVSRLNFFNSDLHESIESPTNCSTAPQGIVTFVAFAVEGATTLWEQNPTVFSASLHLLNRSLRAQLAAYGGYECIGEGDASLFAFQDTVNAYRFASEAHIWALGLPWAPTLLNQYHACVEHISVPSPRVVFRGLRLQTGIHLGEVGVVPSSIPTANGEGRFRYFGKVVSQCLYVASSACGGQMLVSADVAGVLNRSLVSIGSPHVQPYGDRRFAPHTKDAQTLTLLQVTPLALTGRVYHDNPLIPSTGDALVPTLSVTRKQCLSNEMTYLRTKYDALQRSVSAVDGEAEQLSKTTEALAAKLHDARLSSRPYTSADAIAHSAAIDRLNSRCELVKDDVKRSVALQGELTEWVRNLEDTLANFTRASIADDDLKRKFLSVQQRANEKMYDLAKTSDTKLLQLRNALSNSENQNSELREQLSRPQSAASLSAIKLTQRPSTNSRPSTASSKRTVM